MNKLELAFRKDLIDTIGGRWIATIHVENHLNPGVPDLSYVMVAPGHETGWLELKAVPRPAPDKHLPIIIEPSQHYWMMRHAHRVPAHFLILVGTTCYLVRGTDHRTLSVSMTEDELNRITIFSCNSKNLAGGLAAKLSELTRRERNGC